MQTQSACVYKFGEFLLDLSERSLSRRGEQVQLTPKAFDTLAVLVTRSGRLVEKDELLREVWPDTFVEEATLAQNIFTLRRVLGREGREQLIETVPKRGYRFVGDVEAVEGGREGALLMRRQTSSRLLIEEEYEDGPGKESEAVVQASNGLPAPAAARPPRRPALSRRAKLLTAAALAVSVAVAAGLTYRWRLDSSRRAAAAAGPVRSIAVLPFKPLGADSGDDLLGLGMADAVILKLSKMERMTVLPTSTVLKFAGRDADQLAAGRELGVDAVLTGTVQRSGERVRVTVQLVGLGSGRTIWSDKFDDRLTNIFDIQDSISGQVARSLSSNLSGEAQRQLGKRQTWDAAAYDSYLMGLFFWNKRSKEGLEKAAEYFQKAVDADPNYALAYAMLSDCYYLQVYYEYTEGHSDETLAKAKAAAEKALALDDSLAESHLAMSMLQMREGYNEAAMRSLRRALELNPNLAVAHQRLAWTLTDVGGIEEGVAEMKRAQALDALSPTNNAALCLMLVLSGRAAESLDYCRKAGELDPSSYGVRINLGYSYLNNGMYEESLEAYRKAGELNPDAKGELLPSVAYVEVAAGRREEARKLLPEAERLALTGKGDPYGVAVLYVALGDNDRAFEWFDRALATTRVQARMLRYDPQLEPLRQDPRYRELLMRYGRSRVLNDMSK
jgi:DNA-binding winged helix-turn-helix (wHTH) protein/TolB-like protein/tetratricopeptide (TPR) repeat protein